MRVGMIGLGRMGEGMSVVLSNMDMKYGVIEITLRKQTNNMRKGILVGMPSLLKVLLMYCMITREFLIRNRQCL